LLHFLGLRCDAHAQEEIRVFADVMAGMVKRVAPLSFEAWIDYFFAGARMSRMEMELLRDLITPSQSDCSSLEDRLSFWKKAIVTGSISNYGLSNREIDEFFAKFQPKEIPSFDLDLSTAKDGSYFAQQWENAVPKADKVSA